MCVWEGGGCKVIVVFCKINIFSDRSENVTITFNA